MATMYNQWHWQLLRFKISPSPRRQETHLSFLYHFVLSRSQVSWMGLEGAQLCFPTHTKTNPDDVTDFQGESNPIMIHPIIPNQSVSLYCLFGYCPCVLPGLTYSNSCLCLSHAREPSGPTCVPSCLQCCCSGNSSFLLVLYGLPTSPTQDTVMSASLERCHPQCWGET